MPESFLKKLGSDPATKALMDTAKGYATKKAGESVAKVGTKLAGSVGDKVADKVPGGEATVGAVQESSEAKSEGKGKLGQIFGGLKGAVKGLFKGRGSNKRPTNIVEDVWIGLPPDQVYEKWHDYPAHAGYTKGVVSVDVTQEAPEPPEDPDEPPNEDEDQREESNWRAKVWWSNRSVKATTMEDVPGERIKWKTEGAKGTLDGVITFTPLGENATLMLVVLEYRPKGFMEWTANRWRAAGRRVRLDLKHFRRYVMMEDLPEEEQGEPEPDESQDDAEQPDTEVDETDDTEADDETEDDDIEPDEPDEEPEPEAASSRRPRTPARAKADRR